MPSRLGNLNKKIANPLIRLASGINLPLQGIEDMLLLLSAFGNQLNTSGYCIPLVRNLHDLLDGLNGAVDVEDLKREPLYLAQRRHVMVKWTAIFLIL